MERRLAAVFIADVAGYSRLSQADEEGTRTRFRPICTKSSNPRSPSTTVAWSRPWGTGCWSSSRAWSMRYVAPSKSSARRPIATPD